ncbi:hypothetical protein [Actinoplanes sp. NPDC049118]|uniref:hypothetical protein n=1 Tax=Actinoplanes sp. NPDC049118 TaxID=3155769 RepID=UPI0033EF4988
MARKNSRDSSRRRTPSADEQRALATEYEEAIAKLQRSAFWNLRTRIANITILLGVFAVAMIAWGEADGARLVPILTCAVGGVCGAGVYASRPYPQLTRWLLLSAVVLAILGIVGLALMTQVDK